MSGGFDLAQTDHLLTTTRAVRKRLDLTRPVEPKVLLDCIRIASQAPSGANAQRWRWIVVTDPEKKKTVGRLLRSSFASYIAPSWKLIEPGDHASVRMTDSATFLAEHMGEVPALVIPCVLDRPPEANGGEQSAGFWGGILPAVWSFQLALRSRGLGSAWTTLHLNYENEVADAARRAATVTQAALLPVAYYTGTDFKPAPRRPREELTYWDEWKATRSAVTWTRAEDRVAVVTGGTRGIGRAIAEAFLAEGAKVVISGRIGRQGQAGAGARWAPATASHFVAVRRAQAGRHRGADRRRRRALRRRRHPGQQRRWLDGFAPIHELSDEAWENALDWNLNGTFWAHAPGAAATCSPERWGRIIAISSVEGKQANKAMVSHYITNKHAINGFDQGSRLRVRPDGITCNAICPGAIETDIDDGRPAPARPRPPASPTSSSSRATPRSR